VGGIQSPEGFKDQKSEVRTQRSESKNQSSEQAAAERRQRLLKKK
jgi:hypothetical protein